MLWALEPVKYCIAAPRLSARHEPQVGLVAALQPHARLRVAVAEHALDARMRDERRPSAAASPPTARMSMSPHVSQPRRRLPTGMNSTSGACSRR